MIFIEHQMNPSQVREAVSIRANDRRVDVARLGLDVVGIKVQRFGNNPSFLYLTPKAFDMLKEAINLFDRTQPEMVSEYRVREEYYDGDFLMPEQYIRSEA